MLTTTKVFFFILGFSGQKKRKKHTRVYQLKNVTVMVQFQVTRLDAATPSHINKNIGFETPFDLFKTFVQTYGMSVYVDKMKRVYCFSMKKVYDNKVMKDWTITFKRVKQALKVTHENTICLKRTKTGLLSSCLNRKRKLIYQVTDGEDKFCRGATCVYLFTKEEPRI